MSDAENAAAARWLAHMLAGNFAAAWSESDAIRRRGAPDPHRFWEGEDLKGKRVILRCLHGNGDAVQFLRYAPRLRALASHVVVEVPPAMVKIASCFAGVDHVVTWESGAQWDVQVEVMELPYIFRTKLTDLPMATNYLCLPEKIKDHAAQAMGSSAVPRIGIVWAAGDWNSHRSLPYSLLEPLLQTSHCEFWSLQGGAARMQWKPGSNLQDAACCGDGIFPLAAAIAHLDLVITVDTLAAHLAGALGKPTWVLLQHAADWRWMTGRSDSPWYPSVRLFRQPAPGDWGSVVRSVQRLLSRKNHRSPSWGRERKQ